MMTFAVLWVISPLILIPVPISYIVKNRNKDKRISELEEKLRNMRSDEVRSRMSRAGRAEGKTSEPLVKAAVLPAAAAAQPEITVEVQPETVVEAQAEVISEARSEAVGEAQTEVASEIKSEAAEEGQAEVTSEVRSEAVDEAQTEVTSEAQPEVAEEVQPEIVTAEVAVERPETTEEEIIVEES